VTDILGASPVVHGGVSPSLRDLSARPASVESVLNRASGESEQYVAAGQAETQNACGGDVRPAATLADPGETGTRRGDRAPSATGAVGISVLQGGEDVNASYRDRVHTSDEAPSETGESEPPVDVTEAYALCERIVGAEARNFSYGIRLLPRPKRQALSAVYAFARRVDDIGDGDLPPAAKSAALSEVREQAADPGGHPGDGVLVALADAARRYPLDLDAFGELVDGCEMDQRDTVYQTWDELAVYCRNVAGSIGRLSLAVFNPPSLHSDPAVPIELADRLGLALQLTNILRDVREDLENGRVYLPQDDLAAHRCTLELRPDGALDDQGGRLVALIRFQAARAEGLYAEGLRLLPLLDRRSRACCGALAGIYHALLRRIAENPEAVLNSRVSVPTPQKISVALGALLLPSPRR
jgi:phytoene synthase